MNSPITEEWLEGLAFRLESFDDGDAAPPAGRPPRPRLPFFRRVVARAKGSASAFGRRMLDVVRDRSGCVHHAAQGIKQGLENLTDRSR